MKEYNEFSSFADGSDCRECEMYEKDIKKLNVKLKITIEALQEITKFIGGCDNLKIRAQQALELIK